MLKLFDIERKYYDGIHFYFDRDRALNVLFTLNFIELLKESVGVSREFLYENSEKILRNLFVDVYLLNTKNKEIKKTNNLTNIPLFKNKNLITYKTSIPARNLVGEYKVFVEIKFPNYMHDYLTTTLENPESSTLKLIIERPIANFAYNATNFSNLYTFESELLNFATDGCFISNLFGIYQEFLRTSEYLEYLSAQESLRGAVYDGSLPITNFIVQGKLIETTINLETKIGDRRPYEELAMRLIQKSENYFDYKNLASSNSIYLESESNRLNRSSIQTFEKIESLSSDTCDNNIFKDLSTQKELSGTDMLYLATYYKEFGNFGGENFWKDDFSLIPAYIFNTADLCEVYYVSSINENSMTNSWAKLTKENINSLESGSYLCKITSKKDFLNNNLIENYFILVR